MKYATTLILLLLVSCNTAQKAVESAGQKSIVGNGFLTLNKVTVTDPATGSYTPQLFSLFVGGQYVSVLEKANFMFYNAKTSSSVFNAEARTTEETLVIQTDGKSTVADTIAEISRLKNGEIK